MILPVDSLNFMVYHTLSSNKKPCVLDPARGQLEFYAIQGKSFNKNLFTQIKCILRRNFELTIFPQFLINIHHFQVVNQILMLVKVNHSQ